MADEAKADGAWRQGEFVLWSDVFAIPFLAFLVWLGLLLVAVMVAMPILAQSGVSGPDISRRMAAAARQPAVVQTVTATSDLVLLFFLWRIARRVGDSALVARFRRVNGAVVLIALLAGTALAIATMYALVQLYQSGVFKAPKGADDRIFAPGPLWQIPLVFLTVGVVAPLTEEFYFRGVMLSWFRGKITAIPAAVVTALIFALLHFRYLSEPGIQGWMLTGLIAMVGLVNAALAIRTRSLWPPIAFHAGYNGTLAGVAMVPLLLAQHA